MVPVDGVVGMKDGCVSILEKKCVYRSEQETGQGKYVTHTLDGVTSVNPQARMTDSYSVLQSREFSSYSRHQHSPLNSYNLRLCWEGGGRASRVCLTQGL